MTPQAPRELWPNTAPQLMAHMIDDGASRNDPIVGWARYKERGTDVITVEPVIVDPEHDRHLIFARECEEYRYIINVGVADNGNVVEELHELRKALGRINSTLTEINGSITM